MCAACRCWDTTRPDTTPGRAPLEAAALGLALDPRDWIFRVNFVKVIDGLMQDHSAGHITSEEGKLLLSDFANASTSPA